jgi:TolB-like protein/AraC-like DNA-binding protein/Tfp pilus assembly protein PilF
MSEPTNIEKDFLSQLNAIVAKNISNEQFGVSELAEEMNMSRSNLLRKVKKETNLSVSQLISQVRLTKAMELLKNTSSNVSEVSHQVGFGSTSYFIKCFREYYGYPPGEVGKRHLEVAERPNPANLIPEQRPSNNRRNIIISSSLIMIVALVIGLFYFAFRSPGSGSFEKSIAVLPFINDSNDSSNVYLINGLMESTLNNLFQIKELQVISRTSSEKYRNTTKTIPQMSKELNVNYFIEGSGQKIGDNIVLNIQLIEGPTDRHLWSKQYRKEASNIFELQQEIAKDIAKEIQVIITPEEEKKIEKKATESVLAYDYFLKGRELFYIGTGESLQEAIPYFKKAIREDNEFALAYANAAMVYYYLDLFQAVKKNGIELNSCAENAMKYDPNLSESLIAKALSYAQTNEYATAVTYLEKSLKENSNPGLAIHFLTEFYNWHIPNTAKYLEYALMGVKLDVASHDSATTSFKYLHLSNALMQAGFIDEGVMYIDKSVAYDSSNSIAAYVRAWFHYVQDNNKNRAIELLIKEYEKDTTRIDINYELGRFYYLCRDFDNAFKYFKRGIELSESRQLDIFENENLKLAIVFSKMGLKEKSAELMGRYKKFAENDKSIYRNVNLAVYYAYHKNFPKAIEHLQLFSKEENYAYWILLYEMDIAFDALKGDPEFQSAMRSIETKFWKMHKKTKGTLEEKRLI